MTPKKPVICTPFRCHLNWYTCALLLNGEIWTLLTGGDRHRQTHAQAHKQMREVDCERGKKEELNTSDCLQLPQLQPTSSTQTHIPLLPPGKCICRRRSGLNKRTLSQRYQWRTYVSKHAQKHTHSHTLIKTDVMSVTVGFHCVRFLLDGLFILAVYPQSQWCSSGPWQPTGLLLSFL